MSIFRFPCSHGVSIAQTTTFGYLNPPSKASGIAVALFQNYHKKKRIKEDVPLILEVKDNINNNILMTLTLQLSINYVFLFFYF